LSQVVLKPEDTRDSASQTPEAPVGLGIATTIAIILAPLVCIIVFRAEILLRSADLASMSLTFPGVWLLLCMVAVRVFYKRLSRRAMLLIYATIAATVGISTMGMVQFLITTLLAPYYFATPANRFDQFWGHIPSWVAPRGDAIVKGFWLGNSSLYDPTIWHAWIVPVLAWGGFLLAFLAAQYCLAHIFYPRWSREERLTFPIVQLPLMLTEPGGAGKKALLLGAAVAVVIQGMSALNFVYPWIPCLRTLPTEVGQYLPESMKSMRPLYLAFYPCVIGLSALVPTNILYSCVFCFWLVKIENLAGSIAGFDAGGMGFPYPGEQGQGAVLAFALIVLWSARRSLKQSISGRQDRAYWIVCVVAMEVLVWYGVALGLRPIVSMMMFGLFMLFMIGGGWVRAAVGMVWNPGNDVSWFPRTFLGAGTGVGEGVGLAYTRWFSFGDFRAHALPTYADTMRISETAGIDRKQLMTAIAIATVLSVFASLWCALDVYYRYGAATAKTDAWRVYQGREGFNVVRSTLDGTAPKVGLPHYIAMLWGAGMVVVFYIANLRLSWWPFHPVGFVLAQIRMFDWLWLPMAIAAISKSMLLRAGGLKMYKRAMPFFLGLVLGDYVISGILTLLRWLLSTPMYKSFPID
jgi:hypothetical protein